MRNFKLVVEYDGTAYHGFQWQVNGATIQGELERAVREIVGQEVRVIGAGRTDAGVHALGQVANFKSDWPHSTDALRRALNSHLPADIAVREVEDVDERFHARFSAISREYRYTVVNREARPAIGRQYCYHFSWTLHLDPMREACRLLVGQHDFASFSGASEKAISTVRCLEQADCEREGDKVYFDFRARSFLPHMVRNLVGTLLQVGTGSIGVERFAEIMRARDRGLAGPAAPARGLCLMKVNYQGGMLDANACH